MARLTEFARPRQGNYIAAVIFAVLGVAAGIIPYFTTTQMLIKLNNQGTTS
jgi:ATP-binding cassette subfamily B protein IrtA